MTATLFYLIEEAEAFTVEQENTITVLTAFVKRQEADSNSLCRESESCCVVTLKTREREKHKSDIGNKPGFI